jgi:hypothetical protein
MLSKADLIHAWGPVMTISMIKTNVDMSKVLVLPKIDLVKFKIKTQPIENLRHCLAFFIARIPPYYLKIICYFKPKELISYLHHRRWNTLTKSIYKRFEDWK